MCDAYYSGLPFKRKNSIFTSLKTSYIFYCLLTAILLSSCDGYNKLLKSTDYELKLEKANEYYEKKNYVRASQLYEELIPIVKGTPRAEEVYYKYTWSEYKMGDWMLSQYHFKNYARQFPDGKHVEECYYMNAFCYFLNSPNFKLDQTYTKNAIKEFQSFIDLYPQSSKIDTCNILMDELHGKLERKDYEIVKQYYKVEDWKAAIVSIKNYLKEYPSSQYNEELYYVLVDSYYTLALRSIYSKKGERLQNAVENYVKFLDLYPKSPYLSRAETIYDNSKRLLENLQ